MDDFAYYNSLLFIIFLLAVAAFVLALYAVIVLSDIRQRLDKKDPTEQKPQPAPITKPQPVIRPQPAPTPRIVHIAEEPRISPPTPFDDGLFSKNIGEGFVGKNILGILATLMIAIGAVCLGALAGNIVKVLLIAAAGLGLGIFGFFGKESVFRVSALACGEVLIFISIIMAGPAYSLISLEWTLGCIFAFSLLCVGVMLKKNHALFSFTANSGLIIAVFYIILAGHNTVSALLLTAFSFVASSLAKGNRRAVNLLLSDIMLCGVVSCYPDALWAVMLITAVQVAQFCYLRLSATDSVIKLCTILLWFILDSIAIFPFNWKASTVYIFVYTAFLLVLSFGSLIITSRIKGKNDMLTELGLIFTLWTVAALRFMFSHGYYWHITDTPLNFYAILILGVPTAAFIFGFVRSKVYTIIGTSFAAILALVVPYSRYGFSWIQKGSHLSEVGALIWAIAMTAVFAALIFYMRAVKHNNYPALLICVTGAYLSVYLGGSVMFSLLIAAITLAVAVVQYYLWDFDRGVYIISHIFDLVIISAFLSGGLSPLYACVLFAFAQTSALFTVKKALEKDRIFTWVTVLARFNIYVIFLSYNLEADMGFVLSGILLAVAAVLVFAGFGARLKTVRIFGLWQLIAVVAKMCLIDIADATAITRVIAFMGGGVLCLVVHALYSKYEKTIE